MVHDGSWWLFVFLGCYWLILMVFVGFCWFLVVNVGYWWFLVVLGGS